MRTKRNNRSWLAGIVTVIFLRLLLDPSDSEGQTLLGSNFPISGPTGVFSSNGPVENTAAYNPLTKQFLVVWEDNRNATSSGVDLFARLVKTDGSLVGADFPISTAAGEQAQPIVVYNPDANQFLVVWSDYRTGNANLFGQLVNASGGLAGSECPISIGGGDRRFFGVSYNSVSHQYLVAWEDNRFSTFDVFGELLNSDCTPATGDFRITAVGSSGGHGPRIAFNPATNQFLVTWNDFRNGNYDVFGQFVNGGGTLSGTNFAITTASGNQVEPAVAFSPASGKFLVVWLDARSGDFDIFGRVVNADGSFAGAEFPVSTAIASQLRQTVIHYPSTDQFLVAWEDGRNSPACRSTRVNCDTYGQFVNPDGTLAGAEIAIQTGQTSVLVGPGLAYSRETDRFLAVWLDLRNGGLSVFGQLIGGQFALKPGEIIVSDSVASAIFRVDPLTGAKTILSSGGRPQGIAIGADGIVIAADANAGAIFKVDPVTGAQTVISSGGNFVSPYGVLLEACGTIIVVDARAGGDPLGAIIRVDPVTGAQTVLSSGGHLVLPTGVAIDATGNIIVAVQGLLPSVPGAVVRVDPVTGAQTVLSSGGSLAGPTSIAFEADGKIIVGDQNATGQYYGAVLRVDPVTGANAIISSGGYFRTASGVAVDADGNIFVGNQYAPYIVRVDPVSGAQTIFSSGGGFVSPDWVAVFRVKVRVEETGTCPHPPITVMNTATAAVHVGEPINVTAHVTNTGDTLLTVAVVDDKAGALTGPATLAPGAAADYTGSYPAPAAGSTSTNTAIATGVDPLGRVVTATASFTTTIINDPPVVGTLSSVPRAVGDSVLIATGSTVSFSAAWTDVNLLDTHTAVCNVADTSGAAPTTTVAGTTPGSGSGTASCAVPFTSTGIFSVTMTVTDQDGASGTSTAIQVVVYDPSAGFVTGGGWFTPDPSTCVCTPGSKATFGFVSQYKKGTSIPTGNQEFQYRADNISLHSNNFDWLVVSGAQAQFQGTGTINGAGAYKFRVTVRDGDLIGQPDRFEIRILPAGSTDFGGVHLWKGGNDLTGSNGAGSIVIHH